jgi:hypothetical protein
MKNKFIIGLVILAALAGSALATHVESATAKLDYTISGGGTNELTGGGANLQDLKGQEVIGVLTGTDGTILQIGGIYGLVGGVVISAAGVPPGTVPLTISRSGKDIKIAWDAKYANPQIYVMTGDGTGKFQNDNVAGQTAVWALVASGQEFDTTHASDAAPYILHKGQVGAASVTGVTNRPEAYYKGLQHGVSASAQGSDQINFPGTYLQAAWAVGKLNVNLQGSAAEAGKNYVSIPFNCQQGTTIGNVLGEGSGTIWQPGDEVQYKFAAGPSFNTAILSANSTWVDTSNGQTPAWGIDYRFGNIVITNAAAKTLTFIGEVVKTNIDIPIYSGAGEAPGGKTLLGMVYPVSLGLASSSLITDGAANGDMIQFKTAAVGEAYQSAIVSGSQWKSASTGGALESNVATLKLPYSYQFVRYQNAGFTWHRTKP